LSTDDDPAASVRLNRSGAGAAAIGSGAWVLDKSLTPFPKPPEQARLVWHGIYALMRHPVYAGLITLSLGWACLWGSRRGVLLALLQAVLLDAKVSQETLQRSVKVDLQDAHRKACILSSSRATTRGPRQPTRTGGHHDRSRRGF
jgi:hypothetical protein